MTKRTDIHRPVAINPSAYRLAFFYALASTMDGWPVPSLNVNCKLDGREHSDDGRCCTMMLMRSEAKVAGNPGTCTVCGTAHTYGDVWQHDGGEFIFVGHVCAAKYELIADRQDFDREMGLRRVRSAREHEAAILTEAKEDFIDSVEGLRAAFEADHEIINDVRARFWEGRYDSLTPKQVALVLRLHNELLNPAAAVVHVPAVIEDGRQVVTGVVVSSKWRENDYGGSLKITVRVDVEGGSWLAWGTCPAALTEDYPEGVNGPEGATVTFTAKVKQGRDPHFAFFSRPTKASVVAWPVKA